MPKLERLCQALAFVPIGLGAAITVLGVLPLEALFQIAQDPQPTAMSNLRFLGGCFAGLGVTLFIAAGDPRRFAPVLITGGAGLLAGFGGRLVSLAADGPPVTLALALAAAELCAGLAYIVLGLRRRVASSTHVLR